MANEDARAFVRLLEHEADQEGEVADVAESAAAAAEHPHGGGGSAIQTVGAAHHEATSHHYDTLLPSTPEGTDIGTDSRAMAASDDANIEDGAEEDDLT